MEAQEIRFAESATHPSKFIDPKALDVELHQREVIVLHVLRPFLDEGAWKRTLLKDELGDVWGYLRHLDSPGINLHGFDLLHQCGLNEMSALDGTCRHLDILRHSSQMFDEAVNLKGGAKTMGGSASVASSTEGSFAKMTLL